jgi:hypothetical protein
MSNQGASRDLKLSFPGHRKKCMLHRALWLGLHGVLVNFAVLQLLAHAQVELEEVRVSNHNNDFLWPSCQPDSELCNACHQFSYRFKRLPRRLIIILQGMNEMKILGRSEQMSK